MEKINRYSAIFLIFFLLDREYEVKSSNSTNVPQIGDRNYIQVNNLNFFVFRELYLKLIKYFTHQYTKY